MATPHPPTPPVREHYSLRKGSPRGLHPSTSLQYEQDYFDDNPYVPFGSTTSYTSPRPGHAMVDDFGAPFIHMGQNEHGVWRQYDGYGSATFHAYQDGAYASPIQHYNYPDLAMHGNLPTPDNTNSTKQTPRQARRLIPNSFSRTPSPPKRRKAAKKENARKSKLEKPLSELTIHLGHIPIKDTEAWVNRSLEVRQSEVGVGGFIKRPSNSFILYRSAYADRCREYEKSNNHQDISSMAGASWAIESPEIRKQYEDWAKIERQNHQAAFPDYKFQPQTQEAKARKRKVKLDDDSEEVSELDDPTYYGGRGVTPVSGRSTRVKKPRRNYRESSYTPSLASEEGWGTPEPYPGAMHNPSYYHSSNPGKPLPAALNRLGPAGGYYQATSHPNARYGNIGHIEDVRYQQSEVQTAYYGTPPPVGLPGASHQELMGQTSLDNGELMFNHSTLDPDLVSYDQNIPVEADISATGFQANDYLAEDFGGEIGRMDEVEKWDHFDEEV
ncbi:MAG: hypothetical protein Q9217_004478 [Psora testacea]